MQSLNHQFDPAKDVNEEAHISNIDQASLARLREHPWWPLCLALHTGDPHRAGHHLRTWQAQGIPPAVVGTILEAQLPREETSTGGSHVRLTASDRLLRLDCFGIDLLDWQAHAWLQRCDLPEGFALTDATDAPRIGLNLAGLDDWFCRPAALQELSLFAAVWDPDPQRVRVLQAFGVPAALLHAGLPRNGWLDRVRDPQDAMLSLGLPHPRSLTGDDSVLVLGQVDTSEAQAYSPGIQEWPGFDAVQISDHDSARLLAHWLEHCSRLGIQIVRLKPTAAELRGQGFLSLSLSGNPQQLACQYFHGDLHLSVLRDELNWRRDGKPAPLPVQIPSADYRIAWEARNSTNAQAGVCISLYNYADKITTALSSVRDQSLQGIELIVVDDASTDRSLETAQNWLQQNHAGFSRVVLIQHSGNAGLAAARNTAFEAATTDWCFVLDADNHLHPQAVERCLQIARDVTSEIAVIHPLIHQSCNDEASPQQARRLISGMSWQQHQFKRTNYIDAMALIRRSAWRDVGGYSHIEDGWEDYDFWCKLIDKGYQGVLCPQVLATYVNHEQSMIHRRTNRHVRRISRILQARHPWLDLPMAREDA